MAKQTSTHPRGSCRPGYVFLILTGVLLPVSAGHPKVRPDTGSPPAPPEMQAAKKVNESIDVIRDVTWKLNALSFPRLTGDPNSEGHVELKRSLYEARLALADLALTLAMQAGALRTEPNTLDLELAELNVEIARFNVDLARAEMELQAYLVMAGYVPDDRLREAQDVISELRAKERLLAEQQAAMLKSTLRALYRLGIGRREESARPPGADQIPDFPWPPPQVSGRQVIPRDFLAVPSEPNYLGDVNNRLRRVFNACGYFDLCYFAVPDGFALVTRVEQINADGTPKDPNERFLDGPVSPGGRMSFTEYLKALFLSRPGYYRIIVFVVTPCPFTSSAKKLSREQADAWFGEGSNVLPTPIAALKWTPECECTALIYEFEQPNPGVAATPRTPGRHQGHEHLMAAGLWNALLKVNP